MQRERDRPPEASGETTTVSAGLKSGLLKKYCAKYVSA
jgi:hypothetical protein